MSWHIEVSEPLRAVLTAHVGVPPNRFIRPGGFSIDHPYLRWLVARDKIVMDALTLALAPRLEAIQAQELATCGPVTLGEVPVEVLGHPCHWVEASCCTITGSYQGRVILDEELHGVKAS